MPINTPIVFLICFVLQTLSSSAQTILSHPNQIQLTKLHALNSTARETNLSVSPDGKYLYFMSDRGGQPWSRISGTYNNIPRYEGDLWYSTNVNGVWKKAQCLAENVNTADGEDEPMIGQDGQSVVYQSWVNNWATTGGPYYYAQLKGDQFSTPLGLGGGIAQFIRDEYQKAGGTYATDGAAMSPNGKLFIICSGPRYDGPMDLYISRKENGVWSYMQKLAISTKGDERSVFIAGDNKTIYFGSDGYEGLGGIDIYKTVLNEDGSLGAVINIGAPFNTAKDDYGFITTAAGNESYFVRDGDIYFANTANANETIKPSLAYIITGKVTDKNSKPVEVLLELKRSGSNEVISTSTSNAKTGNYLFSIAGEKGSYTITDKNNTIIDTSFAISSTERGFLLTLDLVAETKDRAADNKQKLKSTILFGFDKTNLDASDRLELDQLVRKTKGKTNVVIAITGHTDAAGAYAYNEQLSRKRAEAVRNYLVEKGINSTQIRLDFKGEKQPVSSTAVAKNRRVEISIKW